MYNQRKIIFLVGRNKWQCDRSVNHVLINYLKKTPHEIMWEDPAGYLLYKWERIENRMRWFRAPARWAILKLIKLVYGLFHWNYFSYLSNKRNLSTELRTQKLKERISALARKKEIIIISRSAGGRISSMIADELKINHLICLGYPFRHPGKEAEPDRFLHLETLQTPTLIIQGDQDEYGGLEVKDIYTFSPAIELFFVEGDHDFELDEKNWDQVLGKMDGVINLSL